MDNLIPLMFVGILVVGLGLIAIIGMSKRAGRPLDRESYLREWREIEASAGGDPNAQQLAIIKADKLLDRALKEKNYGGETMGERMKRASQAFSHRESVWAAHKLRNRIAHEQNVKVDSRLTSKALASFRSALKDMGAL